MTRKSVLVTGASSGLGLHMCVAFAKKGYQVIASMRSLQRKGPLLQAAKQAGAESGITCVQLDVTSDDDIKRAMREIEQMCPRIDVLVNNAGFAAGGSAEDIPLEAWRDIMDTNLLGAVRMTQAVAPLMRRQGGGTIMMISSVSGRIGIPGYGPYCASKFALEGFAESIRHELRPLGINVVLIEPGAFKTSIWDKGFEQIKSLPSSANPELMDALLSYSRKVAASAPDPDKAVRTIVRIAGLRSPSLRYALGKGAALMLFGKALLPWRWYERAIAYALFAKR